MVNTEPWVFAIRCEEGLVSNQWTTTVLLNETQDELDSLTVGCVSLKTTKSGNNKRKIDWTN